MHTHIAKSVQSVISGQHPLVSFIRNRQNEVTKELVNTVVSGTEFSWHGRRPTAATLKKGTLRKTNLDLFSVLMDLYRRGAEIELAQYENRTQRLLDFTEQHVGTKRFGPIIGLVAHPEHLSLSVVLKDQSVRRLDGTTVKVSGRRAYMAVDYNGDWQPGWHEFDWTLSAPEAEFFDKRHLLQAGHYSPQAALHWCRRQSLFSQAYLTEKLLLSRLNDELSFCRSELKRLRDAGVPEPASQSTTMRYPDRTSANVFAPTFVVDLIGLPFVGSYEPVSTDASGYRVATARITEIEQDLRPLLQFVVRSAEVAFYLYGRETDFVANWIQGYAWAHEQSGQAALHLPGVTLRYRVGEQPVRVAA